MKLYTTDALSPVGLPAGRPDLQTIRLFFEALPAGRLLEALNIARGKGRDDCPARVLLFCALLQPLLRHTTMSATLSKLSLNPVPRQLGGMPELADLRKPHNLSRLLARLGQEPFRALLQQAFAGQVQRLGTAVPDLGARPAPTMPPTSAPGPAATRRRRPICLLRMG